MAIQRLEEVYLYVVPDEVGSTENLEANAFMDHSGIEYTRLYYADPTQHESVINAVNTWWTDRDIDPLEPVTKFPFVVYTEVRDDIPVRLSPVKYASGLDAIKAFPELYNQYQ